jgi:hypothetical protein
MLTSFRLQGLVPREDRSHQHDQATQLADVPSPLGFLPSHGIAHRRLRPKPQPPRFQHHPTEVDLTVRYVAFTDEDG